MIRRRQIERGGVLLEAILGLAIFSLLLQVIAVSGMSALRSAVAREYRAQAHDMCALALLEVENDPTEWAPSKTVRRDVTRNNFLFTVVQKTSQMTPEFLRLEVTVSWKTGPYSRSLTRESYIVLPEAP